MKKYPCLLAFVVISTLLILTLIPLTAAQTPSGLDPEALKNDSVVKGVENLQKTFEERQWEEFSARWQELLLKNPVVSTLDKFFTTISPAIRIMIGKPYSLSLELFIAFLLWLIMFMQLPKYLSFLREDWMRYTVSLAIVVALANVQIFNLLAAGIFKIIFYKYSPLWKVLAWLIVFVALVTYYVILRIFGEKIRNAQKKKDEKENKKRERKVDALIEGVTSSGITD